MKRLAYLEYTFLFEPDETWPSVGAFERDLAAFFAAHKLEAVRVETEGSVGKRIFHIKNMDILDLAAVQPKKFVPPSQVIKRLQKQSGKPFYKKKGGK